MHLKDGTICSVGDRIRFVTYSEIKARSVQVWREGLVISIEAGQKACNATVAYATVAVLGGVKALTVGTQMVTLGECLPSEPLVDTGG